MAMYSHSTQGPLLHEAASSCPISSKSPPFSSDGGDHNDLTDRDSDTPSFPIQYETIEKLQEGHSGISVMLVRGENGALFVRKVRRMEGGRAGLRAEFEVMRSLEHPNIVRGYAYSLTATDESILMEFCDQSDLHTLLHARKLLPELEAKPYFLCLARALSYCHSLQLAHLDLKPENCFLTSSNQLKLGDFGFATYTYEKIEAKRVGTHCYNSPEVLMKLPFEGKPVDIFALGMILFQIVAGFRPFAQADSKSREFKRWLSHRDDFWRDTEARLERSLFQKVRFSEELKTLVGGMMELQPRKRWKIEEVMSSEWLRNVDFVNRGE